jgi:hypothetical protein
LWLAVRGVDILCGEDSLPDEFFRGLHQCIQQDELLSWVPLDLHHIPLLRRAESLGRISGFSFSDSPPHLVAIYKRLSSLRFDEAMRYSASLQCQDERDRVYALISIVDWGNKSKKRIEPDYEIDVYDLAINLLHWAARDAMSSGWTNLHPGVPASVISLAESVMEGLRINAQTNHKLAQAIQDRYRPATSSKASTYDVQKVLLDEEYAYVCQGFQLRFDNDKWKMDVPEHAHDPSSKFSCFLKTRLTNKQNQKRRRAIEALKEPHHLVSGDSGEPQFLLPLSAEPGDWIVSFEENYLLILREQANGRYNIIGEARGLPDILQCINIIGTVFKVYLGPEDYYLLCLRRGRRRDTDFVNTDQESIIHSLENAVSTAEGSSYAEMAFWEGNRDSSTYISPTATAMTEKKNPVTA